MRAGVGAVGLAPAERSAWGGRLGVPELDREREMELLDTAGLCPACEAGEHASCEKVYGPMKACGCLSPHTDDSDIVAGFKKLKRAMHPERTRPDWPPVEESAEEMLRRALK